MIPTMHCSSSIPARPHWGRSETWSSLWTENSSVPAEEFVFSAEAFPWRQTGRSHVDSSTTWQILLLRLLCYFLRGRYSATDSQQEELRSATNKQAFITGVTFRPALKFLSHIYLFHVVFCCLIAKYNVLFTGCVISCSFSLQRFQTAEMLLKVTSLHKYLPFSVREYDAFIYMNL